MNSGQSQKTMQVLIVGAGAVGALYGAMLQRGGATISIYCRHGCDEILRNGIHVKSIWGDSLLKVEQTYARPETPGLPFDLILVATKVLPEKNIAESIKPFVAQNTTILLIQNGLNIETPYLQLYPDNELLSALAFVCSNRLGLCEIEHLDYGRIVIGTAGSSQITRLSEIVSMLGKAGVPVDISVNIQKDRWEKLVWNVPFNPLSVLGGKASTEDILKNSESRELAQSLMEEIVTIARAAGYPLDHEVVRTMIERTEKMKPYKTSMLLDYEAGRPMEIEAIVGEPLREARRLKVPAPHLGTIHALLLLLERNHSISG